MTDADPQLLVSCDRCNSRTFTIGLQIPAGVVITCMACGRKFTSPPRRPGA